MTFREWRTFFRTLKNNPIYRREAGYIGEPNPFYVSLRKRTAVFVFVALVMGACGGLTNRSYLYGVDTVLSLVSALVCIPGVLISILTLYGVMMAPALTAPTLSIEQETGTWDILRLTPQPTSTILVAKTLGSLRRLGIWPFLLILTVIEGLVLGIGGFFTREAFYILGLAGGITAVIRPWIEILFSAALGMYLSTFIRASSMTLAATYGGLLLFRLLNNALLWFGLWSFWLPSREVGSVTMGLLTPTVIYIIALIFLGFGIIRRAERYG